MQNVQSQANTASQKMAASFKKMGAVITATFSAKMISSFGKSCIDLGSDLAEVQNVVDVTFTSMSNRVNKWSKDAAKSYGLSETMAKKYVGLYGSMAEAFGFTEQQTYDMSTTLTGLAGDVASFYNIEQDLAYTKLKSVFSGETETLKDLGIVMTQNALDAYALANGYGKTTSAMTESEKVTLRYNFVLGQLNNAAGDFTRTQDGWANQTRVLQLRFDSLKATIGQGLINAFTPVIKVVNSLIDRLTTVSEKFKALTEQIFGNAGGSSSGSPVENIAVDANNGSAAIDNIADSAEKAKRSIAGFDKLNILSKNDSSSTTANNSNAESVTKIANGINSPIAAAMDGVTKNWNAKSQNLINSVKNTMGKIKSAIKTVGESWSRVWNNGTGKKFLDSVKSLLGNIIDNIGSVADAFKKAWDKAGRGDAIVQSIIDKWNSLIGLIDTITESFGKVWNNGVGERIWGNIFEIITNCNNAAKALRDKIKEAWDKNDTGKKIWETILGIVEDITGFLNEMSQIRLQWLESLDLSPLVTAVSKLGGAFRELLKSCGDKLKTAYKNILLPLAKWTIENGVPKLVEMLAGALKGVSDVVKKINDKTLYAIAGGITAVGTAVVIFKTGSAIAAGIAKVKNAIKLFITTISAHPLLAIAGAITGIATAAATYNEIEWNNSSLKKELDKIVEQTDRWNNLTYEMSATIDEINESEITMKVDFENVQKMKDKLQEIINDGTIDESEKGEYKTIVDLLSEKVDGFDTQWNSLTLEEIDGKITIKDNIGDVNNKIDDLVANWEIAQSKLTFSEVYSNLQTEVAKQKIKVDVETKNTDINEIKQELIDYIFEKSSLSKKESEILTNELIKQKGDFEKTNKSLKSQFANGILNSRELGNLNFAINGNKHKFESVFGWNNLPIIKQASSHINDVMKKISNLSKEQSNAENTLDGLVDMMDGYESALKAVSGSTKNYNDYIKLSTEFGMDQKTVLSLLKDQGITTWEQLEVAARKSTDGMTNSTGKAKRKSTRDVNDIVGEPAKAANKNVTPAETASKIFVSRFISPFSAIVAKIREKLNPLKRIFSDAFEDIHAVIRNPLNNIMSMIETVINNCGVVDIATTALGNIFGKEWHVKKPAPITLPRFAKGGIVKAPTIAVVGDNAGANSGNPEVISPLNKLQGMINASSGEDVVILKQMLNYLRRIYEMFVIFRNNGGNHYEFVAKINGSEIFDEIVKQNELYKKRHNGKSAFT